MTVDLLKPAEVGRLLRTHPRTLATWRSVGTGPAFLRVGSRIFYAVEDVESFLESERSAARHAAGGVR